MAKLLQELRKLLEEKLGIQNGEKVLGNKFDEFIQLISNPVANNDREFVELEWLREGQNTTTDERKGVSNVMWLEYLPSSENVENCYCEAPKHSKINALKLSSAGNMVTGLVRRASGVLVKAVSSNNGAKTAQKA